MSLSHSKIRDHLLSDYYLPIRDPLWGHIYLSSALKKIVQTREFQQLSRIKQLGPGHLVYPGASHSRLSHSLGVLHIAFRIMLQCIRSSNDLPITLEGSKAFLAAALLHDIGHFPFTHSLKELPLKSHEQLTCDIILSSPIRDILRNDLGVDPQLCANIINDKPNSYDRQVNFFRSILSGPIDPDKLDYLNRDAYFCGIPYGLQDVDYILSVFEPHRDYGFTIKQDAVSVIEGLLFSKYLMYRAVYWYPVVRSATGMIKKALYHSLVQNEIQAEELYGLDDDSFFLNFGKEDGESGSLIRAVYNRELHSSIVAIHFDAGKESHKALENLDERSKKEEYVRVQLEALLGMSIANSEIIIDIPENINFEADIMIHDGDSIMPYRNSSSVFTEDVIHEFVRSLRTIRLIVSRPVAEKFRASGVAVQENFQTRFGLD